MKLCLIEGCLNASKAHGLCNMHYLRQRRDSKTPHDPDLIRIKLKERRELLGMTQQEIADLAHMSRPNYAHIESGRQGINTDVMKRLTLALEIQRHIRIEHHKQQIAMLESLPVPDIDFYEAFQEDE